jgi:tight adherence protein C
MTPTIQVVVLGLIFFAAAGAAAALIALLGPNPLEARLKQAGGAQLAPGTDAWQTTIVSALSPAGKLSLPKEGWERSPLRQQFIRGGFRNENAPLVFFGAKTLLTFILPLAFMLVASVQGAALSFSTLLCGMFVLAAIGYYLPNFYLARCIAKRQLEMFECLPDAIDLMTIMVEAGLGLDAAIARLAEEMGLRSRVVEEEFRLVGLELRAGASRQQALRNLALRSGVDEVEALVSVLVQTDRFGTSMAESLRTHSEGLRTKRRLRGEEAAAKIGVKLLFPIILGIFPSIMIVLLGPAAISLYRAFFPIAGGQ